MMLKKLTNNAEATQRKEVEWLNVSIEKAAKLMNKSQQYLRICLQRGSLPIGNAEKMPGSTRYNYYISPKLLSDYTGISLKQIEESD